MKTLLELVGAIALFAGVQSMILTGAVAGTSLQVETTSSFSNQISATGELPEQIFSSETYQPPDNGGPTTSQGSGTR